MGEAILCLPRASADLWDQKVHSEGGLFVVEEALELRYLLP